MEAWVSPTSATRERDGDPTRAPLEFHRKLPGYAPTPLQSVPPLARRLGVGEVWVKNESARLGLPSFKILGASWGVYRALESRFGPFAEWDRVEDLAAQLRAHAPLELVAATDGNHGRAVARMARLLGLGAHIFVPAGTATSRIAAIEDEGAVCEVVSGTYDDAVARSAEAESERRLVISDTSWPGYDQVPRWVIEGYATIFWEIDDDPGEGHRLPELVVVQIGVGALAAAAARHYRRRDVPSRVALLGVEPSSAACLLATARAGTPVVVPGPHDSIMAGLNCGAPSLVAWPIIARRFDALVTIEDDAARAAMRALARAGIESGETGAAGVGALLAILERKQSSEIAEHLRIGNSTRVLCISTEGATDPEAYRRIVTDGAG
jgi:diaminopropionate ammonia-lyase